MRLFVSALPDERGRIVGYCFVIRDRRERLQAEALLRRQAKLLDLANDAILVRDLVVTRLPIGMTVRCDCTDGHLRKRWEPIFMSF